VRLCRLLSPDGRSAAGVSASESARVRLRPARLKTLDSMRCERERSCVDMVALGRGGVGFSGVLRERAESTVSWCLLNEAEGVSYRIAAREHQSSECFREIIDGRGRYPRSSEWAPCCFIAFPKELDELLFDGDVSNAVPTLQAFSCPQA